MMKVEYEEVNCGICGHDKKTALVPSAKRLEDSGTFVISDIIHLCSCQNCGTVFESPRIVARSDGDYSKNAYYNPQNSAWNHDDNIQFPWGQYNWHTLKDALPWETFKNVADVGAAGAWSDRLLKEVPNLERSILIEPSPLAIFNSEIRYPEVETHLGIFEDFKGEDESLDLVTFFNSIYSMSDPVETISKVNQLLVDGGYLVACFSNASMEVAYWDQNGPWSNMSELVRGVLQIYYSRRSYLKLLDICGFELVDDIVLELPAWDNSLMGGRQLNYVVARKVGTPKSNIDPRNYTDETEHAWAEDFYKNYAARATRKSLALFFQRNQPKSITVLHNSDEYYIGWLEDEFLRQGQEVSFRRIANDVSDENLRSSLDDTEGHFVFVVDYFRQLRRLGAAFAQTRVIHGSPMERYKGYGEWIELQATGEKIITRSFCPDVKVGDDIFAFERRASTYSFIGTREEANWEERPSLSLPVEANELARLANIYAMLCERNKGFEQAELGFLAELTQTVNEGIKTGSILDQLGAAYFKKFELKKIVEIEGEESTRYIRQLIQWAGLYIGRENFIKLLETLECKVS